jgi:hypothetical protein
VGDIVVLDLHAVQPHLLNGLLHVECIPVHDGIEGEAKAAIVGARGDRLGRSYIKDRGFWGLRGFAATFILGNGPMATPPTRGNRYVQD